MKRLFVYGRSESGKTSLKQALKNEALHYEKTQAVDTWDFMIDSPGEYAESKELSSALVCFGFEADVCGLLCAADEPYNMYWPCDNVFWSRPLIGIITKIDSPKANVPMVEQWLIESGCERVFLVDNLTGKGIQELREYLEEDMEYVTLEEAIKMQSRGIRI